MLPAPLRTVDDALARRILDLVDSAGELPQAHPSEGVGEVLRTGGDTRDENG
jgi:hypothetical protein